MLVVAAVGCDLLRRQGKDLARTLAELADEHHLVLALGSCSSLGRPFPDEMPVGGVPSYPLEVFEDEMDDSVGLRFERGLAAWLPDGRVATMLTRVTVDGDDPAFTCPTTPVGPLLDFPDAERLARAHGWAIAPDSMRSGWRRVVASPRPRSVVELATFRILVDAGVTVIWPVYAAIPVMRTPVGRLCRVEAAIEGDVMAALLAVELDADALLLLTDPDDAGGPGDAVAAPAAVHRFVEQGGWLGSVVPFPDAPGALRGEAGVTVRDQRGRGERARPPSARVRS
jgi:carbamate kinase